MGEEKSILRMGGLGGILSIILLIAYFAIVAYWSSIGSMLGGPAENRLPTIQEVRMAFPPVTSLALAATLLWIPFFFALYRLLTKVGPARALLGGTFGVLGAFLYATAWVVIMVVIPYLSDRHAAATAAETPMVLIAANTVIELTHSLQDLGILLVGLAFASLGWAMLVRPDIRKGYGWASLALGLVVAVSGFVLALTGGRGIGQGFGIGGIAMFALFALLGWKVYSLSRTVQNEGAPR